MGRYSIDYTAPETFGLMAALPYYGQACELIRAIDPLWKVALDEPRDWDVRLERECGCNCPHCEPEIKHVTIEATTKEEAEELAADQWPEWEVDYARLPQKPLGEPSITIPDEFYEAASAIYAARHPGQA